MNCKLNGEIANESLNMNNRSFNLTDFYYILLRSFKNSIIRGWKLEVLKAFCLFCGVIIGIILYPNDIGSDPSCSIDILNEFNISQITDQLFDFINGKRSNGELNVTYLLYINFCFGFIYMVSLTFLFPTEIKVNLLIQKTND